MMGTGNQVLLSAAMAENVVSEEIVIVRGMSLSPLIKPGAEVKALYGYYQQHSVGRGDIVLVDFAGRENPLIKIVKGMPQDSFALQKAENGNGWNILINSKILKNSENKDYALSGKRYQMLSLYVKDYNGIIPENAYLLLGNTPIGSLDATRFGLISRSSIIAKVEQ